MKKVLPLCRVAGLCALVAPLPAAAQSSVTVSGLLDLSVRTVRNEGVGTDRSVASGGHSPSRLTLRGTEDLGGGLAASFHLEHGVAADTGSASQSPQFWDRRAVLSLVDPGWGELRIGRDYVPTFITWGRLDPFGYVGVAGSATVTSASQAGPIRAAFGTAPTTTLRANNTVQYLLPAILGGLQGGLMLAAGEGGMAAAGQHKVVAGRLGYAAGSYTLSLSHGRTQNNLTGDDKFKDTALGGSWELGRFKLLAAWRQFELREARQANLMLGTLVQVGAGELRFSWIRADMAGQVGGADIAANDARLWGLGYVHNLSRRTALYVTLAALQNRGDANFAVPGGPTGLAGGDHSRGAELGVRHTF